MCVNCTRISSSADSEHSAHFRHSHAEFILSDETKKNMLETICWLLAHCLIPHVRKEWHAILGSHFSWWRKYLFLLSHARQIYIRNLHDLRDCSLVLNSLSGLARTIFSEVFVYHIVDAKNRKRSCRQSDWHPTLNLAFFFIVIWRFRSHLISITVRAIERLKQNLKKIIQNCAIQAW